MEQQRVRRGSPDEQIRQLASSNRGLSSRCRGLVCTLLMNKSHLWLGAASTGESERGGCCLCSGSAFKKRARCDRTAASTVIAAERVKIPLQLPVASIAFSSSYSFSSSVVVMQRWISAGCLSARKTLHYVVNHLKMELSWNVPGFIFKRAPHYVHTDYSAALVYAVFRSCGNYDFC